MGQLGVVITQHHWTEVFLEEVNGQGGRTLLVNGHVFVTKASHTVIVIFLERIMSDALEKHDGNVSIGGRNITNLRFAVCR